jgi:hypothetical protein
MAVQTFLDFEKPIAELEARVAELRETANAGALDLDTEIGRLEAKSAKLLRDTYSKLTPWQKAQVARHPERPHGGFPSVGGRPRVRRRPGNSRRAGDDRQAQGLADRA